MPYKDLERRRKVVEERRAKNTDRMYKHMLDECWLCNENDRVCLEFHHINPEHKDINVSSLRTNSWETTKPELDKCVLLCANCHRKVHARRKDKRCNPPAFGL